MSKLAQALQGLSDNINIAAWDISYAYYNTSDAWDISTANYIWAFSVASQETAPYDIFFKPDGTKMYAIGANGDDVNEYNLSTAWNIDTASYSQNFSVASQEIGPRCLFFKPDGTKMYVAGTDGDDVNEYNLSTAWDISTASYSQNFSVSTHTPNPYNMFFKPDGTKVYLTTDADSTIDEYNLSTAWDISTASYNQNYSATQTSISLGIFFKPDGTKMYVMGTSGDSIYEYNLSTAWDISTASYNQNFSVTSQETNPYGIFFKPDGTLMYVIGTGSDTVHAYLLNGLDVSSNTGTPYGIFFKSDGTKLYLVSQSGAGVFEYNLSTAWDVITASYSVALGVGTQETSPTGIFFKPDGTKLYVVGTSGDNVNEYDLSTAWDVSTATYSQNFSVATQDVVPQSLFFKPDGTKMYVLGSSGDAVYEYNLSTAWDVSSASYSQSFSVATQETTPTGLFFKPDGTKLYVVGSNGDDINEYDLSTAWDVSSATYSQNFILSHTAPRGIFFKPDGTKMYISDNGTDAVHQLELGVQ